MNPNMTTTFKEHEAQRAEARSPIEDALERLHAAQDDALKAFSVLKDRVEPITQPEEPKTDLGAIAADRAAFPQSAVLRRINEATDGMDRLTSRIHRLVDRIDT